MHWHITSKLHPWNNKIIFAYTYKIYSIYQQFYEILQLVFYRVNIINNATKPCSVQPFMFTRWLFSKISCQIWKCLFKINRIWFQNMCIKSWFNMTSRKKVMAKVYIFFVWPLYTHFIQLDHLSLLQKLNKMPSLQL